MYFNNANNTNIDNELKKTKTTRVKKKFYFTRDMLLMCFYALLLITGIVLIIISLK